MPKRKEIKWSLKESQRDYPYKPGEWRTSDVTLAFTSMVGVGSDTLIPWAYIDTARAQVNQRGVRDA